MVVKRAFYTKIKRKTGSPRIVIPKKVFDGMGLREDQTILVTLEVKKRLTLGEQIERNEKIVRLKDEEGMSFKDIAEQVGIDVGHVRELYRSAKEYTKKASLGPSHIPVVHILSGDVCSVLFSAMGKEKPSFLEVSVDELVQFLESMEDWRSELLDMQGIGPAAVKRIEDMAEEYGYEL